jgi:hypothetical protein
VLTLEPEDLEPEVLLSIQSQGASWSFARLGSATTKDYKMSKVKVLLPSVSKAHPADRVCKLEHYGPYCYHGYMFAVLLSFLILDSISQPFSVLSLTLVLSLSLI